MTALSDLVTRNRAGEAVAMASVCYAQRDVLCASLLLAQARDRTILIEATSNQVNQFGGYTGMQPADFIAYVHGLAKELGVDRELYIFGGDHLGPQVWRAEDAGSAMAKARDLMRAYVEAGFTKIHLDCSEGCKGEPAQIDDDLCARRAAALATVCETYALDRGALSYVVGTEVPPPGGARGNRAYQTVAPTLPDRASHTLKLCQAAFDEAGIEAAWRRVIGLVVQPGLEFSSNHIDYFDGTTPDLLSAALIDTPHLAFEAHSTDYQHPEVFSELARRHFAVLKVGPALTFAYRKALYALDAMSPGIDPRRSGQEVADVMEAVMINKPVHWLKHYQGDSKTLRLLRHFGYADRIRYYWREPKAQKAADCLLNSIAEPIPLTLLGQYFTPDVIDRAAGLENRAGSFAHSLIWAQVQEALNPYLFEVQ